MPTYLLCFLELFRPMTYYSAHIILLESVGYYINYMYMRYLNIMKLFILYKVYQIIVTGNLLAANKNQLH